MAGELIQACLLVLKVKFEVNDLVFDAVHFLLQFVKLVENHYPLIRLEAIPDQGRQFLGPVVLEVGECLFTAIDV